MIIRVVVATTLLLSAFVIELLFRPAVTLKPFYLLTGLTYALTLAYAFAYPRFRHSPAFASLQIFGDILLTTVVVIITGGVVSNFSFLYVLSILTASTILYRRGAMLAASLSWIAYATMVLVLNQGLLPEATPPGTPERVSEKRVTYALFAHLVGFLAVGYLSSAISEKLRETGEELAERREDLAALQVLHRNIIDSIHTGIVTTDQNGILTFMNGAAERITGHPLVSQVGKSIAGFLGEEETFLERISGELSGRRRYRFEKPFRSAGGKSLFLGIAVSVLRDQGGSARGYIFIFRDLTEIKALEEELRLKDRMSVLGRMAAGMAHELRNPLASMSGSVQMLRKELHLNPEQAELMGVILEESHRLDQTIRDFLLFARPSPFHPGPADLAQVLSESLALLRNSAELRADHSIHTDFNPPKIPFVFDVNQMKQIFWNLAKNSLKAMPDGGELSIRIDRPEGHGPVIMFADQGIGMDSGEVQRFFQPFETAFPDGTGLGLAIVYRNVQEHQGRLFVESEPGKGTRFTIRLPADPPYAGVRA